MHAVIIVLFTLFYFIEQLVRSSYVAHNYPFMNQYGSLTGYNLQNYRSGMHVQLPLVTYSAAQYPLMCYNKVASQL